MKKIDLGQSISILANIGVLIGIVLLVLELNHASQATQGQTRSDIANQQMTLILQRAINPSLADLYLRGRAGEPLTDLEEEQLRAYLIAFWRHRENASYQYRNGLFEEEEYGAIRESWRRFLREPTERASFCSMRGGLSPVFVSDVEALLENPCD
jgi:hypothetical protein